jgi:ANTAR domain
MAQDSMRLQVRQGGDARALVAALGGYDPSLSKLDGHWEVAVQLGNVANALLADLFGALASWLGARQLSSCQIVLGTESYTFLRAPLDGRPGSPELLLERTSQLQTALDSRVVVERATGFLAGKLDLSFDQAFALLRQSARNRRVRLHDLAERVVAERSIPEELPAGSAS